MVMTRDAEEAYVKELLEQRWDNAQIVKFAVGTPIENMIYKDIKDVNKATAKGEKLLSEAQLQSCALKTGETGTEFFKIKSALRHNYVLAEGSMTDAEFCDYIVRGLVGHTWDFMGDRQCTVSIPSRMCVHLRRRSQTRRPAN